MQPIKLVVIALLACGVVIFTLVINTTTCGGRSPTSQTLILVHNIHAIATDYEVRTGEPVPGSYDSETESMKAFTNAVTKEDIPKQMLMNLGREFLTLDADGEIVGITDAWGRSLWYVPYNNGQTNHLPQRGSATAPQPMVLSSGRDGRWGTYNGVKSNGPAMDNVKSFQD